MVSDLASGFRIAQPRNSASGGIPRQPIAGGLVNPPKRDHPTAGAAEGRGEWKLTDDLEPQGQQTIPGAGGKRPRAELHEEEAPGA